MSKPDTYIYSHNIHHVVAEHKNTDSFIKIYYS